MYFLISFCSSVAKGLCSHTSSDTEHEMHSQLARRTGGSRLLLLEYLTSHPANCPHVNGPFWGACQVPFKQACSIGLAGLVSSVPQTGTARHKAQQWHFLLDLTLVCPLQLSTFQRASLFLALVPAN